MRHQHHTFDLRHLTGPFDIVGDIHGCINELRELAALLGYQTSGDGEGLSHPEGRTLVFLGDINDRGPDSAGTFALVMKTVGYGNGLYTPGNHCSKLLRYLLGAKVQQSHGLADTIKQIEQRDKRERGFSRKLSAFIQQAPPYLWLSHGDLVVAHAGIKESMIGKFDEQVKRMVVFGDITGEQNPDGTPVRLDWAQHYRGVASIVYGHTPVPGPVWRNKTINIDQGCVFGGWLTALRWPEREVFQVRAHAAYEQSRTPAFILEQGGGLAAG